MAKTEDERRMTNEAGAWENGRGENDEAEREYAMGRTWIMEDIVKKLTSYLIAILMVVWAAPAFAAHWAWVEREVAPVPLDWFLRPTFMAYDKSDQKLTLVVNDPYYGTVQVWKFTAPEWTKVWEGVPDLGAAGSSYHFSEVFTLYYDENLGALVAWGSCPGYVFETHCYSLFKYTPGIGFVMASPCIEVSVNADTYPPLSSVWDPVRKRAIFVGCFLTNVDGATHYVTVEYDGAHFYYIRNTEEPLDDVTFAIGTSGYDPCTNRVVFYGQRYHGLPIETWEYDGQTWTLVPTNEGPPLQYYPPIGMIFVPELKGLLVLPNEWSTPVDSWLFSGGQWRKLSVQGDFSGGGLGQLVMDPSRQMPVFYGGLSENGDFVNQMWEFRCAAHCKPVSKP